MSEATTTHSRISLVIPVYSGEAYLDSLVREIKRVRERLEQKATGVALLEAIFVLDEPVDNSIEVIRRWRSEERWIRPVELSRNFGQHNATVAGILHSSGDWVITLDEDGQHPPAAIPELLASVVEDKSDILFVTPKSDTHKRSYRNLASRMAKRGIAWLSGNKRVLEFASFRVIRGEVARAAASVCTNETYFDMALLWFTNRVRQAPMELEDPRYSEKRQSGYNFLSLLSHAKRLIFSSDIHYFRLAFLVSGLSFALAFALLLWVFLSYYLTPEEVTTEGWASLMSVNLFFGGTLAILMGLVLEFVRSGLFHGQGKPAFFVVDREGDQQLQACREALRALSAELMKPNQDTRTDG